MADKSVSLEIFDDYDVVVNDFCCWEILDPYHDSDSDDFSFSDGDAAPADDVSAEIKVISQYFGSPSSDDDVSLVSQSPHHGHLVVDEVMPPVVTEDLRLNDFVSFPPPAVFVVSQLPPHFKEIDVDDVMPKSDQNDVTVTYDDFEGKYDDQDDDEAWNNDLYDDELVPIGVSDKLGKQRMRKSGKKGYGRKKNSKKLPHYSTRPGCVHGKHGLGVHHLIV